MTHFLPRLPPSLLVYWASLLGAMYVFAELSNEVYEREPLEFDAPIFIWFNSSVTPELTAVALTFSFIGSVYVLTPALIFILAFLSCIILQTILAGWALSTLWVLGVYRWYVWVKRRE